MTPNPINTYDQVGQGGVYVGKIYMPGRTSSVCGWAVFKIGFDIDPRAKEKRAWYDPKGAWLFPSFTIGNKAALAAAQAAAGARFGITRWKRNGMGDYVDANAGYLPLRSEVEAKEARAKKKALAQTTPLSEDPSHA